MNYFGWHITKQDMHLWDIFFLNAAIPFKLVLFQEVKLLLVLVNKKLKIKNYIQNKILWLI